MKGIIFTEFLEMVEDQYGLEVVDFIIENSNLESDGIYTSIGTYDFTEMLSLITNLSNKVSVEIPDLLFVFGKFLFYKLGGAHPEIVQSYDNPLSLLQSIEDHIHVHVKKLYQDAQLPTFRVLERSENHLVLLYESNRGLYMLAYGLMLSCFNHFSRKAEINYELLAKDGSKVKFDITQNG